MNKDYFLYELVNLCHKYYQEKDKSLFSQITEIWKRCPPENVIFESFRNTRLYGGRINTECAEDIRGLETGDTFKFSQVYTHPIRVWCKNKKLLEKHIEHKLFEQPGRCGIMVTELVNKDNIIFDFESYNILSECGKLDSFSGVLKESFKQFKFNTNDTINEVLVDARVNRAEVCHVMKPFESLNTQKMVQEITKSLGG